MNKRHAVFLLIGDTSGNVGAGESWINFPVWAHLDRLNIFDEAIIPWLVNRSVTHIPDTVDALYRLLEGPARQSGTVGPLLCALCAVELALWDLAGQAEGKPLAEILFETPARTVRVYASGINSPLPWELIDLYLDQGVTLFKLKLGFGEEEDKRNLSQLKKHLGNQANMAVDVNRGWTLAEAQRWLPILEAYEVAWLEEPLTFAEEKKLAVLQGMSSIPLAGGENVQMEPGSDVCLLAEGEVDILQPDITKYTPLHVALELWTAVEKAGKRMIPHSLGSGLGQAASLHLAAGLKDRLVELDINENPLRTDLCQPPFQLIDGCIELPKKSGLGWRLRKGVSL